MELSGFPTSSDIYLEAEGKKIAVVQSYTAKAGKTSQTIEALDVYKRQGKSRCTAPSGRRCPLWTRRS